MLTRLTVRSLCIMSISTLVISHFGFKDGTSVLVAPVLDHCLRVSFKDIFFQSGSSCASSLSMLTINF